MIIGETAGAGRTAGEERPDWHIWDEGRSFFHILGENSAHGQVTVERPRSPLSRRDRFLAKTGSRRTRHPGQLLMRSINARLGGGVRAAQLDPLRLAINLESGLQLDRPFLFHGDPLPAPTTPTWIYMDFFSKSSGILTKGV